MQITYTSEPNAFQFKLEELLKQESEYINNETGELKINVIKNDAQTYNDRLLKLLLSKKEVKEKFFIPVLDSFVFNIKKFCEILEYSSTNNSYSAYLGKKIGLYYANSALEDCNDVVLNFPFKDCVLEGGQTKEDGQEVYYDSKDLSEKTGKRKEIFYNQILAQDEIDSLFAPKAFCNAKKYFFIENKVKQSTEEIKLNRDAEINKARNLPEDTITDNLLIKGNNLLALHSLEKEFAGKVKLIYIDPPYNTGSDSFAYNDNFNHSSWLTFMKNRLEIAKTLLRDDGAIFVQCDDNEQAYLKVLMDEVFEINNFVNCIAVNMSNMSGQKINNAIKGKKFPKLKEYLLFYSKEKARIKLTIPRVNKKKWDNEYNKIIPEWKYSHYNLFDDDINYANEKLKSFTVKSLKEFEKQENIKIDDKWKFENAFRIFATKPNSALLKKVKKLKLTGEICFVNNSKGDNKLIITDFNNDTETARLELVSALTNNSIYLGDNWEDIVTTGGVAQEGNVVLKKGKKPEKLIKRIIDVTTKPNEIVLDYHLGSGTTAAVAHKMGRQYIGIEQLNYGENDSVVRLQNVIKGDKSGISKSVNWQGGGSFVYAELAKKNQKAMELINDCNSLEELLSLFNELCSKYFLHYNVHINDFKNEIMNGESFKSLSLEKQKEMLCRMLDLNQLYVNVSDRNDKSNGLTRDDITFTEDIYRISKKDK